MKNLMLIIMVLFSVIGIVNEGSAQNDKIVLKSGKVLKKVRIHSVNKNTVEYEKDGSLHDIAISEVQTVVQDTLKRSSNEHGSSMTTTEAEIPKVLSSGSRVTPRLPVVVKFSPLGLIEPDPSVRVAVEFPLGNGFAFQQEAGFFYNREVLGGLFGNQIKNGWIARSELKYYLPSDTNGFNAQAINKRATYFSIDGFYKEIRFDDSYNERKIVYGGHFKVGQQVTFRGGFTLDYWGGFGFKSRTVSSDNLQYNYDTDSYIDLGRQKYQTYLPNMTMGVKLGWAF